MWAFVILKDNQAFKRSEHIYASEQHALEEAKKWMDANIPFPRLASFHAGGEQA